MKRSSLYLLLIFGLGSCSESTEESDNTEILVTTDQQVIQETDSLIEAHHDKDTATNPMGSKNKTEIFFVNPNIKVKDWKTEDFIVSTESDLYSQDLMSDIAYYREQWSTVKSPFKATYMGNEFGDYFHIIFEDSNQNAYDFGFGNNEFGKYQLFEDGDDYTDNPVYLKKEFLVHWQWKVSTFPCCSGEFHKVEAYLPSITKLELVTPD